ncbi:MAG: ABC transporter ATP-binding protein [Chloroflexi bacterium]|nr:MAG: ABC transporter ATP-binding protein [Chloroflexota bacterium]
MNELILSIENLSAEFLTPEGVVNAVNHVSLELMRGGTLAITGESGSGKTSIALCILDLLPHPGRITGGSIRFQGVDLLGLAPEEMRRVRGRRIAMVFQDPSTGLNPVLSVGQQVEEAITTHLDISKREAKQRSLQALAQVGLPDPEAVIGRYPFQLSGGMAQRVMIAVATALEPEVLILDEPTSALDVTVQAAILEDLKRLQQHQGTSMLLITHDLGVVAQMADEVIILYAGTIAERAAVGPIFQTPLHPYTWSLLGSRPRPDRDDGGRLASIRGTAPNLIDLPDECPFLPRCPKATNVCRAEPSPALVEMAAGHRAACYNPIYHEISGEQGD